MHYRSACLCIPFQQSQIIGIADVSSATKFALFLFQLHNISGKESIHSSGCLDLKTKSMLLTTHRSAAVAAQSFDDTSECTLYFIFA
jgi:hypothetical protein